MAWFSSLTSYGAGAGSVSYQPWFVGVGQGASVISPGLLGGRGLRYRKFPETQLCPVSGSGLETVWQQEGRPRPSPGFRVDWEVQALKGLRDAVMVSRHPRPLFLLPLCPLVT